MKLIRYRMLGAAADDLDAQAPYRRGERLALGDRRRACARERRDAEVREQPLKAAGDRNRQEAGPRRGHQVSVRNTSRQRDGCSRRQTVGPLADANEDLAVEHDHLLVLARVDVEWQANTARLL